MAAGAPWSVKGINPRAREVAKDLARRSGMTLGEWLNRVILDDDMPEEAVSEPSSPDRLRSLEAERPWLRLASVSASPDLARLSLSLDSLAERVEVSETRTGLAITGVEHAVREALARIETAERTHAAQAGSPAGQAERLDRLEAQGPRSAEALRALETSLVQLQGAREPEGFALRLGEMGERLAVAEARTGTALADLRQAVQALDGRLGGMETGGGRLDLVAEEVSRQVTAVRDEVAQRLARGAPGELHARLQRMESQLRAGEQRSAEAIDRLGREVLGIAQAFSRRLQASEQRSAQALEQVGGEIARIVGAVEGRLGRAETVQAVALEKLGAEIGRITDRLGQSLEASESRAAQAITAVGDQVARVSDRLEERQAVAQDDLAQRIAASEARIQTLLDQAQVRIDGRSPVEPIFTPEPAPTPDVPFSDDIFARAEGLTPDALDDVFAPIPEPGSDLNWIDPLAPAVSRVPSATRDLSTREVIDQARAAARAAQGQPAPFAPAVRAKADRRLFKARRAEPARRTQSGGVLQTALMVAGGAAFLSVGAAGVVLMEGPSEAPQRVASLPFGPQVPRIAVARLPAPIGVTAPVPEGPTSQRPVAPVVRLGEGEFAEAVAAIDAGQPGGLAALRRVADSGHAPAQFYLAKLYEGGKSGVLQNMTEARAWTARAAEGGDRKAMHNLALYAFRGDGGPRDLTTAASWFRKAARLGVVDSQFNLGLMHQSGSGVPRDLGAAYAWFSIAAEGGDGLARANAIALEAKLSAPALAAAERQARDFSPVAGPLAQAAVPAAQASRQDAPEEVVVNAQRILGRLGYYKGPIDGQGSLPLRTALADYQRAQGIAATGSLDPNTQALLSVFAR